MTGLLLINLGTPDAPTTGAVRKYLAQFLSDPRVIDMNPVGRWLLLHLIILRTRPSKSAAAYREIWDDERGSPLLYHSEDLTELVRKRLGGAGDGWAVELAMRYGSPSIESGLEKLKAAGANRIVVFPLFPQFASSSTGSALEEVQRVANTMWNVPILSAIDAFYDDPSFIGAFAEVSRGPLAAAKADHVLFSFHGLPERHMRKSDESGGKHCLMSDTCCDSIVPANRNCYRAQCYATARALAAALELDDDGYEVAFQSRLGRDPWIKPYTDHVLDEIAARGVKRLAVYSPAFVADCLETIEELGIRAREQFKAAGGEELTLIPSLNASEAWADAVVALVAKNAEQFSPHGSQ